MSREGRLTAESVFAGDELDDPAARRLLKRAGAPGQPYFSMLESEAAARARADWPIIDATLRALEARRHEADDDLLDEGEEDAQVPMVVVAAVGGAAAAGGQGPRGGGDAA